MDKNFDDITNTIRDMIENAEGNKDEFKDALQKAFWEGLGIKDPVSGETTE